MILSEIPNDLTLEGPRLILRPIKIEDSIVVTKLYNDSKAMKDLAWLAKRPIGWNLDDMNERLQNQISSQKKNEKLNFHVFLKQGIINNKEEIFIGVTGLPTLNLANHEGTIGVIIDPKFQKSGYGTEMNYLVLKYAFETIKLHRVAGETSVDNKSMRGWFENVTKVELESIIKDLIYWDGKYYSLAVYPIFEEDWFNKTKSNMLEKLSKHIGDTSMLE